MGRVSLINGRVNGAAGGPCDAGSTATARSILPLSISVDPRKQKLPAVNAARGGAAEPGRGANAKLASPPEGGMWWWWEAGNP